MIFTLTRERVIRLFLLSSFLVSVLFGATVVAPANAYAADVTLTTTNDTSMYQGMPTIKDYTRPWLWVGFGPDTHNEESYVGFSRDQLTSKMNAAGLTMDKLSKVTLRLYIIDEDNPLDSNLYTILQRDHQLLVKPVKGAAWSESSMDWNGRGALIFTPEMGDVNQTITKGTARKTWVSVDVTNLVKTQNQTLPTQSHFTYWLIDKLWNEQISRDIAFASKEYAETNLAAAGGYAPQLVFSFTDTQVTPPSAPATEVVIRTTFTATPGQEPTPTYGDAKSPWPRIAFYLNNGWGYRGMQDAGSCTDVEANSGALSKATPSCGTQNLYREKLVEEFEVPATSFTKEVTVPIADLIFSPNATMPEVKLAKLSFAYHNDYWAPLSGQDRNVSISKVEIINKKTGTVIKTLEPAKTNEYLNSTSGTTYAYLNSGASDFSGLKDGIIDGMSNVFDLTSRSEPVIANGSWLLERDSSLNFILSDLSKLVQCGTTNNRPGDTDLDNDVDIFDFNRVVTDFGKKGSACFTSADLDGDGDVDIFDFNVVVGAFGKRY
ncbi:DNRLRE domain-containing protein [Candidatus Woesebacteria bacterium]|nr:DNRLRE domain-containing protein [Candidatus Woesebacteria bacterium]